jgi:hypothetical protein
VTRDKAALATEVAAVTARAEDERTQREAGLARLARLQKLYVCLHPTHSDMLALADEHAALLCLCLCLYLYLHVHVAGIVLLYCVCVVAAEGSRKRLTKSWMRKKRRRTLPTPSHALRSAQPLPALVSL